MRKKNLYLSLILSAVLFTSTSCQNGNTEDNRNSLQAETFETGEYIEESDENLIEESSERSEEAGEDETDPSKSNPEENTLSDKKVGILNVPVMSKEDYPRVNGSTATIPLSQALYRLSTGASKDEAETDISHDKTTNSYLGLIYKSSDLAIAYEPAEKVYEAAQEHGVELDIRPIGKDALVFLTNEGNPVQSLSGHQIVDIYSGKIKNWSEVGGQNKEIAAFQRPEGSGSQTLMKKLIMKNVEMAEAPVELVSNEMGELIEDLADYNNEENALGYSVYYYAHNMYHMPGLRLMGVDQVMPDNNTIRKGTYPYVNEFYAAVRKDEPKDSNAYRLFQWLTSENGQIFVESMGYVAVSDVKETKELFREDEELLDEVLDFGENQRLVVNKDILGNGQGSFIIDRQLNCVEQDRSYNYNFVGLLELKQPVEAIDKESGQAGVVKFGTDETIIPFEYDNIREWNDFYVGDRWGDQGNLACTLFDRTGKKIKEIKDRYAVFLEDYIWSYAEDRSNIEIFDKHLNLVKSIDFTRYGRPAYELSVNNIGIMVFEEDNYVIWNLDGTDIFDSREIPADVWEYPLHVHKIGSYLEASTTPYTPSVLGRKWIVFSSVEDSVIYDREKMKVTAGKEKKVEYYKNEPCYTVEEGGKIQVCDTDGKVLTSSDGTGYSMVLGDGYFGYIGDGQIIIENPVSGERYVLNGKFNQESTVQLVADHTFLARTYPEAMKRNDGKCYLFSGERKMMERDNLIYSSYQMNLVSDQDSYDKLVLDDNGEVIYASAENEFLYLATPSVVVAARGNYLCILNSRGRCVMKMLFQYMTDD